MGSYKRYVTLPRGGGGGQPMCDRPSFLYYKQVRKGGEREFCVA